MKTSIIRNVLVLLLTSASTFIFAQQAQTLKGTYRSSDQNTISCPCNSQGLLSYVNNTGKHQLLTLCFDTEPGDFYTIYNGENISVSGYVYCNVTCENGQQYCVMYVTGSEIQIQQRQLMIPESIKKLNTNIPKELIASGKSVKTSKYSGYYIEKYSTKTAWYGFDECTNCGKLIISSQDGKDYREIDINFDRAGSFPKNTFSSVEVEGYQEGNFFYVTNWLTLTD